MDIRVIGKNERLQADAQVFMLFQDYETTQISEPLHAKLDYFKNRKVFELAAGTGKAIYLNEEVYIVVGLGKQNDDLDLDDLRQAAATMVKIANEEKLNSAICGFQHNHIDVEIAMQAFAESVCFASYQFENYKSEKKTNTFQQLSICVEDEALLSAAQKGVIEGQNIATAVSIARNLVDEPACAIYPETLANEVVQYGEQFGFEVEVFDQDAISDFGMHAFLAVSKGSAKQPKLIVMRYNGDPDCNDRQGWVGKGLTYDAGGLSIKTAEGMEHMKTDMAGAAAVIGAMVALAKGKARVNVTAVVASCENMISGESYKPGDILNTMKGKTIYIGNTDAEGRLTLVDAITYIIKHEAVNCVIDIATLTGAALMALGNVAALAVSNDDELYGQYEAAAKIMGEKVWRMPTFKEYSKLITHHEADLTNMAGRPGSITAALVLKEFVEDKPWIHIDIAGVAHYSAPVGLYPKGASGYGVKTLYATALKYK